MTGLLIVAGLVLLVYATWTHYAAVMHLMEARDSNKLTRVQKPLAYLTLGVGLLIDVLLNVVGCTLLFLELPREWLVTQRLIRHKRAGQGWRYRLASWLCAELLDTLDPKGCHCRTD